MVSMTKTVQMSSTKGIVAGAGASNRPGTEGDRSTKLDLSYYCLDRAVRAVLPLRPAPAHAPLLPGRNGHMRHPLLPAVGAAVSPLQAVFSRLADLRHNRQRIPQMGRPHRRPGHPVRADLCLRHGPGPRQTDARRLPRAPGARACHDPQKNVRPTGIFYSPLLQMNASTGFPL